MKKLYFLIIFIALYCTGFGQLTGIQTIPGSYATITAAITALNAQGVGSGGVTFNVAAGYTETASNLIITATGTLANPIIFQKSGAGVNPLIIAAPGVNTTLDGIIILQGTDYITFNGIDLRDPATNATSTTQMEWGYALLKNSATDGCQNVLITNCTITLQRIYASSVGIYVANHLPTSTVALTITAASGSNSNNHFYANVIQNVNTGITISGYNDSSPYSYYDQNNDIGGVAAITGNTIQDFGGLAFTSYGVNVIYQNGCNISYNTINNSAGGGTVSANVLYGIQYSTSSGATGTINNNAITLSQGNNASRIYCISSGINGTGNLTVNNNSFTPSYVTGASGNLYCIYITAAMNSTTVSGNQFINCPSLNTTGSIYFVYNSVTTPNITVSSNSMSTISKPSAGGSVYGYYTVASPIGGTETINSNTFSGITVTGATAFYGVWSQTNSATQNKAIYNNIISGITGGASPVYGIYCAAGNTCNIYGNTVNAISTGNGSTGVGTVYAYYLGSGTTVNSSIYSNTAFGITNVNLGSTNGMYIGGGTTVNVYKNSIYTMTGSVAASIVYGYYVNTGTAVNLYNNFVSNLQTPIGSSLNAICGIYINGGTTIGIYYNSLYLNAVSTAGTFGTSGVYTSTTPTVDMRNNNIVNNSTAVGGGLTSAYRRSSTTIATYASVSNNNNFYAGISAGATLFYDGSFTYATLSSYKSFIAPMDAQSISEDPPFVNVTTPPFDLHLKTTIATSCESGGTVITTPLNITSDYDGDARYPNGGFPNNISYPATAPDIGADEFAGIPLDVNGPVINYTALLNTSSTTNRTLTATITDISGIPTSGIGLPHLYWKMNAGAWNSVAGVSIGGNQYTFTFGAGVVLGNVVSYYIVAQDNDTPTPLACVFPAKGASGFTLNPPAVSTPPTSPSTYTILGSLCGTYNVGIGQTYNTLTAAIADLNTKIITCPVTFLLTDPTYASETFPMIITPNIGSSPTNTITISPASGVTPNISGSSASGILIISGADYVIIDGSNSGGTDKSMTWQNTNTVANTYAIGIANAGGTDPATNTIIRNCIIESSSQLTNNTYGIYMNPTGGGYDNTVITNNTIYNARNGILFGGAATLVANNGQITNNTIGSPVDATSIVYRGVTVQYSSNTLISGNEIMGGPSGNSNWYQAGIYVTTGALNTKIRKNKIHDWYVTGTGGWGNYGIYYGSDASTITEISNNLIYQIKGDGYTGSPQTDSPYGIYIASGGNCQIWFNSIYMTGSLLSTLYVGAFSACLSINPGITTLDLRNNIFKNSMQPLSGAPADYTYLVYCTSANTAFSTISYNDYWDDGVGANIGYIGSSNQASLPAWQTATGQDAASVNVDPAFISPSDLHTSAVGLSRAGNSIASITDDFAGTLRANPPDIGAYQFSADPVVTTTVATGVTCGSATLNGVINPNNSNVTTGFDYGPTVSYGTSIAGVPATVTGNIPISINAVVSGLVPNVSNHFRAKGTSGGVTIYGTDMTITPPCTATAVTTAASSITSTTATLNGTINPNNLVATVTFDYGLTIAYGTTVSGLPSTITGNSPTPSSVSITGLIPGTTYHFRINGANTVGTANGNDMTFTTPATAPTVVTTPATVVTANSATLNGTVNANGASTTVTFNYGLTAAYGSTITATPATLTGNTTIPVSGNIAGLTCNTIYHYRISGVNSSGTSNGTDMTFTTLGAVGAAGTITGLTIVCQGATNVIYSVPPITGATGYTWSLPAGATIVAGVNTNSITVNFSPTAISGNITVYGTNFCMNGSSSSFPVTVNILPVPTINGPAAACVNSTGNIYTTEPGMSAYTWMISAGGVITGGAGTNTITVSWNLAGPQTLSINYTNGNGCMASTATIKNITVNPLPVPTITGLATVCTGTTGVTYTTEAGMTGYSWTISAGGTITAGSGTQMITITWNTSGSQTVSVIYTNTNGCTSASPTVKNVSVNQILTPTISGAATVCAGTTGVTYVTETGMTNYIWAISAGGTITSGGTLLSNTVTVTWNTSGAQWVSVNYTNSNGCTSPIPTIKNVTVNPLPVPTITGPASVCAGTSAVTYSTETGMTAYSWTISSGGTIYSGLGTSAIIVAWTAPGAQIVSVNYVNSNGCTATSATIKNVTVNALPFPTITGLAAVCAGTSGVGYSTETGMTNYSWSISTGGVITSGAGSNSIVVTWNTAGSQTVSVNYTNSNGCIASNATVKTITVNPLPVPTITGAATICAGTTSVNYSTEQGMTGYSWNVSAGGTITSGNGTNTVSVNWNTAGPQTISVNYTNANGCTATSPTIKNVSVNPVYVPTITGTNTLCISTQTYVYSTETGMNNYIWSVSSGGTITSGGTINSHTVTVRWNTTGSQWVSVNYSNIYGCSSPTATKENVTVNPVPIPTITGNNKVCAGTSGVIYTTQAGMSNYTWLVSAGGTITAGGTSLSNTVTITWNVAGSQTVAVNYANSSGCMAGVPVIYPVIVYALPQPTLTGPVAVCVGTASNVYTTQTGMTNYIWNVSPGGIITAGGSSTKNTITVTWITAGPQYVSVNYTNPSGCTTVNPVVLNVTVNLLPVPTITGSNALCSGVAGVYTTETGKTNYSWTVSTGAMIVAGGTTTSSSITVKWATTGSQWIRVNYSNPTGCRANNYTQFNVIVNALPVPSITGITSTCQGTTGIVYSTQSGMTGYTWTVSTGGLITAGAGTNTITVSWTGYGSQWVKVNYSNSHGCSAATPVQFNVTVNQAPVPSLTGTFTVCRNTTVAYSTDAGKSNYIWTISAGGTFVSGVGTSRVYVVWNAVGTQTISVIYTTTSGCPVLTPTVKTVTVNAVPTPTITGPVSPCVGAYVWYVTEAGMTNYTWTLGGSGGIIYSGFTSHQIYVKWTTTGAKTVSVNYTSPGGCRAPNNTVLNVNAVNCSNVMIEGIDTNQSATNFMVYPNPNNGKFTARVQCECHDNCSIDVFNMMGIKVFELTNLNMESKMEVPIDLQNLPQGIYTVILHNSNQWMIRKIVINR